MSFPLVRMRRLRKSEAMRRMVAETVLNPADFIYPLFVCPGENECQGIGSMPGVNRFSIDALVEECQAVYDLGVPAVILFGIPEHKDALGTEGYSPKGIIPRAVRAIKKAVPGLLVVCDVCLCEYTSHGHCGVLEKGKVHNDATLELLARASVAYAQAGCDIVAPSDMMDGRVWAIREGLDDAGLEDTPIMSYAAKYASAFYGPFREAADSAPQEGDRRGYQMDPPNFREALREVALDVEEGADMLMVKPALPYLDVLSAVRQEFDHPLGAYQVSGEYAMIKAAGQQGWVDEQRVMMESLTCIKRAGADFILTYFAKDAAALLGSR
ncbi:MAG: porphobilinogen synthase [Desulfarculaceae bacterium]|nr:porphobilinogen synthase [Desulfarculaceae bacterium]MCF8074094.1 porphobilinogen synthase [Desulfarculaceae bacterium]MCF8103783.1 porphobilinogen synthase [Desulfarculaceae bacterium]MCF8116828.1 porphobilinogen synthase [Desulfarculaceae bacterium]